jgi:16S rRNA (uracil1498-N3)-methyltransferase
LIPPFDSLFYSPDEYQIGQFIAPDKHESHHVFTVKKRRRDAHLYFTNGRGELAECSVDAKQQRIVVENVFSQDLTDRPAISIAVGILRQAAFSVLVEKASELGVRRIIPLHTQHTGIDSFRPERWQRLAIAAMKQSKQLFLPDICAAIEIESLAHAWPDINWLCLDQESDQHLIAAEPHPQPGLIIGPEGGLSKSELSLFKHRYYLGPNRLRAETAAIAGLCTMQMHYYWTK